MDMAVLMAMVDMVMADPMVDMEAMAMERGRLRPLLMLRLLLMLSLAMDMAVLMAMVDMVMADPMVDMEAMAMERGRLRPLLMLSLAMDMAVYGYGGYGYGRSYGGYGGY